MIPSAHKITVNSEAFKTLYQAMYNDHRKSGLSFLKEGWVQPLLMVDVGLKRFSSMKSDSSLVSNVFSWSFPPFPKVFRG